MRRLEHPFLPPTVVVQGRGSEHCMRVAGLGLWLAPRQGACANSTPAPPPTPSPSLQPTSQLPPAPQKPQSTSVLNSAHPRPCNRAGLDRSNRARQVREAEEKKLSVRERVSRIRSEFEALLAANEAQPEALRLPRAAFEVDPGLRQLMEAEAAQKEEVRGLGV